ncbi:hypothetical protein D9M71_106300 [compost metagenome]
MPTDRALTIQARLVHLIPSDDSVSSTIDAYPMLANRVLSEAHMPGSISVFGRNSPSSQRRSVRIR